MRSQSSSNRNDGIVADCVGGDCLGVCTPEEASRFGWSSCAYYESFDKIECKQRIEEWKI